MGDDPERSRLRRAAKLGSLAAGGSARVLGARAAGLVRSPERARRGEADAVAATGRRLVAQLGEMKGPALKLGQLLSTVDLAGVPEADRASLRAQLASLRDQAPRVPFARQRALVEAELGVPLEEAFAHFDPEPIAAASIGQVFRARTPEGAEVAVKVQYPGISEVVEGDLRTLHVALGTVGRLAPSLDAGAIADELRDRMSEELDYELEAQHQRAVGRALRGHPFLRVPAVDTQRSTRRVLVTELAAGIPFGEIAQLGAPERDRVGEMLFRAVFGLVRRDRLVLGDPHPGNVLLAPDGALVLLDFGLVARLEAAQVEGELGLARAVMASDAAATHAALDRLGYLPDPARVAPGAALAHLRDVGAWWAEPGERRLDPELARRGFEAAATPRSAHFAVMRRETIPAHAVLLRRMDTVLLGVLGELHASADWHALLREHADGSPPTTALGRAEADWAAGR